MRHFGQNDCMKALRILLALLLLGLPVAAPAFTGVTADFDRLELALRLKPAQKAQFDAAVASTQRALLAVAMGAMQVKERIAQELAKPRPDLNVLYDIHEQVIEQNKPLFREVRDEWSKLYALLDPEQVEIAKRYIEDKLNILAPK
jgi:polyribonucleotide nucleotidyltransferase